MKLYLIAILRLCFSHKFILPECKNCRHFRPYWMISHIDEELSECALFGEREGPNSKYFIYNYEVTTCREDESLCGKNGTFFQSIITKK